jgi:hypothetical protein
MKFYAVVSEGIQYTKTIGRTFPTTAQVQTISTDNGMALFSHTFCGLCSPTSPPEHKVQVER